MLDFLVKNAVLLVHFAPAPGEKPEHEMISGCLQFVLRENPYLCCATIKPDDHGSWGKVGLIIMPHGLSSVTCVGAHDVGSEPQPDGTITCRPEFRNVTWETCQTSIDERGDMNEWVINRDRDIVGIFVTDMTSYNEPDLLRKLPSWFPGMPIYTARPGAFVKCEGAISFNEVAVEAIYSRRPR